MGGGQRRQVLAVAEADLRDAGRRATEGGRQVQRGALNSIPYFGQSCSSARCCASVIRPLRVTNGAGVSSGGIRSRSCCGDDGRMRVVSECGGGHHTGRPVRGSIRITGRPAAFHWRFPRHVRGRLACGHPLAGRGERASARGAMKDHLPGLIGRDLRGVEGRERVQQRARDSLTCDTPTGSRTSTRSTLPASSSSLTSSGSSSATWSGVV